MSKYAALGGLNFDSRAPQWPMAEKPRGVSTFNACEAAHPSQALAAGTGRYCSALGVREVVAVCRRVRTAVISKGNKSARADYNRFATAGVSSGHSNRVRRATGEVIQAWHVPSAYGMPRTRQGAGLGSKRAQTLLPCNYCHVLSAA